MSFSCFLRDKIPEIILNMLCSVMLTIFLLSMGNNIYVLFIILVTWYLILMVFYIVQYIMKKKYYDEIIDTAKRLDKKYLISEVIKEPRYADALTYYVLLKMANKAMIEEITNIKNGRKDYKECIEQWVHEIKTPISSIKLICDNNKSDISRVILLELENINNFVEQVLFYARSENVEKDYLIKEISLQSCVDAVVLRNKHMFIQNNIEIELYELDKSVYSDNKWIEFIINQLLINSIKYRNDTFPKIKIYAEQIRNSVSLVIEDNGIGIPESELSRVFNKGYTGINGRNNKSSTGMGLYLCKRLCDKLGLVIKIISVKDKYTKISIIFPKGSFTEL
ncbi:sensor histidine kinase GraS [Clostridium tepidiprofundi DSM 19306]|uniref:histidine kinase n=1 Tax=Clostridium tepidiprofundi DSM 19306 TaxID=1121338 RepID=A0A151B440_9CLOT|nr:sensor histidine kinase [Clostridium tepidiprofundi]KYH34560.1 sensor histidine kinase GraS [Clostridium tepidiprofundi DSM 19306]